jgi:hypothetical protein
MSDCLEDLIGGTTETYQLNSASSRTSSGVYLIIEKSVTVGIPALEGPENHVEDWFLRAATSSNP